MVIEACRAVLKERCPLMCKQRGRQQLSGEARSMPGRRRSRACFPPHLCGVGFLPPRHERSQEQLPAYALRWWISGRLTRAPGWFEQWLQSPCSRSICERSLCPKPQLLAVQWRPEPETNPRPFRALS